MIAQLIDSYAELTMQGVLVIAGVWVVWYLLRSVMGMLKNGLKDISKSQERLASSLDKHDENATFRDLKIIQSVNNLLDLQNGSNPKFKEHDDRFDRLERRIDDKRV